MTEEQAKLLAETHFWEQMTDKQIAYFQLFEDRLCMPWAIYHRAVEKALGRSVWTHEFGFNLRGLQEELLGEADPPTMQDIIEMIPPEKRIIVEL